VGKTGNGRLPPSVEQTPLRVLRIDPGTSAIVKTISPAYGGLYTHWRARRGVYCRGSDCEPALHKTSRIWKGYGAVEVWDEHVKRWFPWVLEITEAAELDLRGLWERGQVWQFDRLPALNGQRPPTTAKFLERVDLAGVRPVFEIRPTLQRMYHVESIDLSSKNPMPQRTMLEPTDGPPPPGHGSRRAEEKPATAEDWMKLRAAMKGSFELPE
jgi:hypothetical protein